MTARGRRLGLALALLVVAGTTGCDGGTRGTQPIRGVGRVVSPRRPLVVAPLPAGWAVQEVRRPGRVPDAVQTLYLAPGSTPEHGPALAIGSFGQDQGFTLCGRGRSSSIRLDGPEPSPTVVQHRGSLRNIEGEISTDTPGYVFARDLSERQLLAAARAAHFAGRTRVEIPARGLPDGFRRVASAPVIPNGTFGDRITLTTGDGRHFVSIGAYDGDAAADLLTRFWNATATKAPCGGRDDGKLGRAVAGTDVYLSGNPPQVVDEVADHLVATDPAGLQAFRAKVDALPAAALVHGCLTDLSRAVIIGGTVGRVRWVVGMDRSTRTPTSCTAFTVDGHPEPGAVGGGTPAVAGPGSHEVDVLGGGSAGLPTGTVTVVAGSVPRPTRRVVVSDATGAQTEATLATVRFDPAHQYFGGVLSPSSISNASLSITVVAYDAAGHEIGRFNPPTTTG